MQVQVNNYENSLSLGIRNKLFTKEYYSYIHISSSIMLEFMNIAC